MINIDSRTHYESLTKSARAKLNGQFVLIEFGIMDVACAPFTLGNGRRAALLLSATNKGEEERRIDKREYPEFIGSLRLAIAVVAVAVPAEHLLECAAS